MAAVILGHFQLCTECAQLLACSASAGTSVSVNKNVLQVFFKSKFEAYETVSLCTCSMFPRTITDTKQHTFRLFGQWVVPLSGVLCFGSCFFKDRFTSIRSALIGQLTHA